MGLVGVGVQTCEYGCIDRPRSPYCLARVNPKCYYPRRAEHIAPHVKTTSQKK